jgi:hypothetical protein
MSALLTALAAAPALQSTLSLGEGAVTAVRKPFAAVLQAAADCCRPQGGEQDESADSGTLPLEDRVSAGLARVLSKLEAPPGAEIRLSLDAEGRIAVDGPAPLAERLAAALGDDRELSTELEELLASAPSEAGQASSLSIRAGFDGEAELAWV